MLGMDEGSVVIGSAISTFPFDAEHTVYDIFDLYM